MIFFDLFKIIVAKCKFIIIPLCLIFCLQLKAQVFADATIQNIVKKSIPHLYNSSDSVDYYIGQVSKSLPNHPIVPLMKAIKLLWKHIPIITSEIFETIQTELELVIEKAEERDPEMQNPEMIYFSLVAYGLLAEYYADQDRYIDAVDYARHAYVLIKKGFNLVDEYPEFLFMTGLYNYFREAYPEKYPIYKPFIWVFRRGSTELGLQQLRLACSETILSVVEAYVYLSYIYLRFEYKPERARLYLEKLCKMFPNNDYAKAKYLEALIGKHGFVKNPTSMIKALLKNTNPYYKLAGFVFQGFYFETSLDNVKEATISYKQGLAFGSLIENHGEYFKSLGYLGLGRIYKTQGYTNLAKEYLKKCINIADTDNIKQQAKAILKLL